MSSTPSSIVDYHPGMASGAPHRQLFITAHQHLDLEEIASRKAESPWGTLDDLRRECDILPGEVVFNWVYSERDTRKKMVEVFTSLNGLQRIKGITGDVNLDQLRDELMQHFGDENKSAMVLDSVIAFNLRYQGVAVTARQWHEERKRNSPAAAMQVMGPAELIVGGICVPGQFLTIKVDSKKTPWARRTDGSRQYFQGVQTSKRLVSIVPVDPVSIAMEFSALNDLYLADPKLMAAIQSPLLPASSTQYGPLENTHRMLMFAGINFLTLIPGIVAAGLHRDGGGAVNNIIPPLEAGALGVMLCVQAANNTVAAETKARAYRDVRLALYAAFGLIPRKDLPGGHALGDTYANLFTAECQTSLQALRTAFLRMTMYSVASPDHHTFTCLNTLLRGHLVTAGMTQTGRGYVADSSTLEGQALMMQRRITGEFLASMVDQAMRQRTQIIGRVTESSQTPLVHALIS